MVAWVLLPAAGAAAADKPKDPIGAIAVGKLEFENVAPYERAKIRTAVIAALPKRPLPVGAADPDSPPIAELTDHRARIAVGKRVGADLLVEVTIGYSGKDVAKPDTWTTEASLFSVAGGEFVGFSGAECRTCSLETFLDKLPPLFAEVFRQNQNKPVQQLALHTACDKPVRIKIDNHPMGYLPFDETLFVGSHEIVAEADGYQPLHVTTSLDERAPGSLDLTLVKQADVPVPPAGTKPSVALKAAGGALVGAGAVGIIAGAVLLALDGKGTCSTVAGQVRCPDRYDTGLSGGAVLGAGVAAGVVGAVLLIVDAKRASKVQPAVTTSSSGASVGVAGEF